MERATPTPSEPTPAELKRGLEKLDLILDDEVDDNRPDPTSTFLIRFPPNVKEKVFVAAQKEGMSANVWAGRILAEAARAVQHGFVSVPVTHPTSRMFPRDQMEDEILKEVAAMAKEAERFEAQQRAAVGVPPAVIGDPLRGSSWVAIPGSALDTFAEIQEAISDNDDDFIQNWEDMKPKMPKVHPDWVYDAQACNAQHFADTKIRCTKPKHGGGDHHHDGLDYKWPYDNPPVHAAAPFPVQRTPGREPDVFPDSDIPTLT
jgi:hypothetical protein